MKICATVGAGTDVVDLANVDRGGVVKKVNNDVANSAVSAIYGFVDPKT